MMSFRRTASVTFSSAALAMAGCGSEPATVESTPTATPTQREGGALGGGAATATLGQAENVTVPAGRVAWVASEVRLEPGRELRHSHSVSTVLAREGAHRVSTGDSEQTLAAGEGAVVQADRQHRHVAGEEGASVFWEVRLAAPGSPLPNARNAERVFESEPLEGIPPSPTLRFIRVDLSPGSQTSVHTHPGPEFIYGLDGRFTYENGLEGERQFGPGDQAGIPPETAVQKRNQTNREATFLSWFLVDPRQPFAPGASFDDG